jgi:hypothetical protein
MQYINHKMTKLFSVTALVFLWLTIIMTPLYSQAEKSHDIVLGNLQLKDGYNNLGMVFNGAHLEYRYGIQWKINEHEIRYQPKLGMGLTFNRGMFSAHVPVTPINVTWKMPIYEQNGHTIRVGANFMCDYHYILYNELHDGPLFWTAETGLSPVIRYSYQWNDKRMSVRLQNSLLGFTSHRQGYDSYKHLFSWRDFVVHPHKEMKFGSFNNYNHTNVSVEYMPNISQKHSFMYEFDYFGIFNESKYSRLNHNLIWRISL